MSNPLDLANQLLAAGIPVIIVRPGDIPVRGWGHLTAADCDLSGFRPGTDALALVGGHGVDLVDVDTKDGKHGSVENLPSFKWYGTTRTPSGGIHYIVPSCGVGKVSPLRTPLGFVGDYVGGRPDGSGRLLGFLPGSTRTKYPNGGYVEETPWDIEACLAARPDKDLVLALLAAGGAREARPVYVDDSPARPAADGLHPYALAAVVGELAKLDECNLLGWAGQPWNNTLFAVSCNLIELANSGWSGYTLERAEEDMLDRAPVDEGFNLREHMDRWSSALNTVGEGGRVNPDSTAAEDFTLEDVFSATPTLRHIRQAAHARMVSAPALLCYVLVRVIAETPPSVALPPVVGGKASLNLAIAAVGSSGDGKSVLFAVSRELMGLVGAWQTDIERNVGSGEGLVQQFLSWNSTVKANLLISDPRRILLVDEIDQMGATKNRTGATIAPTIRSALTGGPLGQANAVADRNRHVPAGSYRLVMMLGVQPTRSGTLLEDADAGTPQRLVWVNTKDPTLPDEDVEWPGPLSWEVPDDLPALIDYPDHIKQEVRAARRDQVKNGGDPLDGHRLLTRLKVATALALLHGGTSITDQWWELAGRILTSSMAVQNICRQTLLSETRKRNELVAQAAGVAAVVTGKVVDADLAGMSRAGLAIRKAVILAGADGMSWTDARHMVQYRDRDDYALRAREALEAAGHIRVEDVSVGNRKGERIWSEE